MFGTIYLEDFFKASQRIDKSSIRLQIIVLSSIPNYHKRQAIRETWGQTVGTADERTVGLSIDLKFVVGTEYCPIHPVNRMDSLSCEGKNETNNNADRVWQQKMELTQKEVRREEETHKDILFVDMIDVYRELPQKLLLSFQKLFQQEESEFTHLLKTDDDCYINIWKVIELTRLNHDDFAVFGK